MNKIEIYYKLKSNINKDAYNNIFNQIGFVSLGLLLYQAVLLLVYYLWFITVGDSVLIENGLTFEEIFWPVHIKGSPLYSIFLINMILYLSMIVGLFQTEKVSNFIKKQNIGEIIGGLFFIISMASTGLSIHLGFILVMLGFAAIFCASSFFISIFVFKKNKPNFIIEQKMKKIYDQILKDLDLLRYLDENKSKYFELYHSISKTIILRNKDKLFKEYCKEEAQKEMEIELKNI